MYVHASTYYNPTGTYTRSKTSVRNARSHSCTLQAHTRAPHPIPQQMYFAVWNRACPLQHLPTLSAAASTTSATSCYVSPRRAHSASSTAAVGICSRFGSWAALRHSCTASWRMPSASLHSACRAVKQLLLAGIAASSWQWIARHAYYSTPL